MANTIQTSSRRDFLYGFGAVLGLMATPCVNAYAAMSSSMENTKLFTRCVAQEHMGTFVHITARSTSQSLVDDALESAFNIAKSGEQTFTRHGSYGFGGALMELNEHKILKNAPRELISIIEQSKILNTKTSNAFNPTIAPVLTALAAYKACKIEDLPRSVQKDLSTVANPQAVVLSEKNITLLHNDMSLTLDGIAKGRVVDMMAESLESACITDYCINAGGDIRMSTAPKSATPWKIGIQDAKAPARYNGVLHLHHGAVATSANHESLAIKGYEHLVGLQNQHNGPSQEKVLSATVIAPNCAQADAMATALFVMAKKHGIHKSLAFIDKQRGYACQLQTEQGIFNSQAWPA